MKIVVHVMTDDGMYLKFDQRIGGVLSVNYYVKEQTGQLRFKVILVTGEEDYPASRCKWDRLAPDAKVGE